MPKLFFPMQPGGAACQDPTVAWTLGVRERHWAAALLGRSSSVHGGLARGLRKWSPARPPLPSKGCTQS